MRKESKFKWFDLTKEQEEKILSQVPKDLKLENLSDEDYREVTGRKRK
jgi:hypothetical protein